MPRPHLPTINIAKAKTSISNLQACYRRPFDRLSGAVFVQTHFDLHSPKRWPRPGTQLAGGWANESSHSSTAQSTRPKGWTNHIFFQYNHSSPEIVWLMLECSCDEAGKHSRHCGINVIKQRVDSSDEDNLPDGYSYWRADNGLVPS